MEKIIAFIKSHATGLFLVGVSVAVFLAAPFVLHLIDPTAGAFDSGYVLRPVAGSVFFFALLSMVWFAWEHCFPTLKDYVSGKAAWFPTDFAMIKPEWRVALVVVSFTLLLTVALLCFALVPVS